MSATDDKVNALKELREKVYADLADLESDCLTIDQVREALGIGRSTYYRLVEEGYLVPVTIRGNIRVPCVQVASYIEELGVSKELRAAAKSTKTALKTVLRKQAEAATTDTNAPHASKAKSTAA